MYCLHHFIVDYAPYFTHDGTARCLRINGYVDNFSENPNIYTFNLGKVSRVSTRILPKDKLFEKYFKKLHITITHNWTYYRYRNVIIVLILSESDLNDYRYYIRYYSK